MQGKQTKRRWWPIVKALLGLAIVSWIGWRFYQDLSRPVTSGMVVLVAPDGKTSDPGPVQPDGTYTILHAPMGTVKVSFDNPPPPRVSAPGAGQNAAAQQEAGEAAAEAKRYVPTPLQYKDPEKSSLTLQLKKGKNDHCDLDLK